MSKLFNSSNPLHTRSHGRVRSVTLLVALALASTSVETRAAPPESTTATTVRVVVDASALGADAGYFETEIKQQISEGLTAGGLEVSDRGGSTVRIKLEYFDERDRDFLISTDVVREGRMAISQKPTKCPACVDEELVDAAVKVLPEVLEVLRADPQNLPAEGPNEPAGDGDGDGDVELSPTVKPIGPMGYVGVGALALGVGGLVWGAVELKKGRVYDEKFGVSHPDLTWTDHTPRGRVLVGVGVGGAVVGAALLTADLVLRSKRRKSLNKQVGAAMPLLSPDGLGLVWTRRF